MESVLHVGGCHRTVVLRRCSYMAAEDRNRAAYIGRETDRSVVEADAGTAGLPGRDRLVAHMDSR